MKKVLLIFNGINSPENVVSFIKMNLKVESSHFHGIFINKLHTNQAYNYPFPNDLSATSVDYSFDTDEQETYRLIKMYINLFEDECKANNMAFKADFVTEVSLDHLIERSGYVDLIISDRKTEFDDYSIDRILTKAHCPVLLIGTGAKKVTKSVLTYDGSTNSMHAIRQYSYLLPELSDLDTSLFSVIDDEGDTEKQQTLVKDWMIQHFSNFNIEIRYGKPEQTMVDFIKQSSNALVVMGAYGRSTLSRWANSSHAEKILSDTNATIFITHLNQS